MAVIEVAIICSTMLAAVGTCACAWYMAQTRAAVIQQQGIDRRAAAKGAEGSPSPYQHQEWWVPLVSEALKNPEIIKLVAPHAEGLITKFLPQKVEG